MMHDQRFREYLIILEDIGIYYKIYKNKLNIRTIVTAIGRHREYLIIFIRYDISYNIYKITLKITTYKNYKILDIL